MRGFWTILVIAFIVLMIVLFMSRRTNTAPPQEIPDPTVTLVDVSAQTLTEGDSLTVTILVDNDREGFTLTTGAEGDVDSKDFSIDAPVSRTIQLNGSGKYSFPVITTRNQDVAEEQFSIIAAIGDQETSSPLITIVPAPRVTNIKSDTKQREDLTGETIVHSILIEHDVAETPIVVSLEATGFSVLETLPISVKSDGSGEISVSMEMNYADMTASPAEGVGIANVEQDVGVAGNTFTITQPA